MDFTFSDDQTALCDSLRRFLATEAAPGVLREIGETGSGRERELHAKLAGQGLAGLSVPESEGGMGLGDVDWALLAQALGYHAIPDSLADTAHVAVGVLARLPAGHPLRREWLPRIVDGRACVAVGHPVNPWIAGADAADLLLLPRATAQGAEVHAVPRAMVDVTPCASIDASRRLARVEWAPRGETCIADAASGGQWWDEALDRATINVSAQLAGLAQRMLDLSVDYAAQREQFGKPIGSFQAIKHQLADVVTRIEFAKPVLYHAADALARGLPSRAARVSHAKLACADAAWTAARKGIQVHGAMGYAWEVDLQLFMKRAWALDAAWGDRAFHKARLAAVVLAEGSTLGPAATFGG